MKRVFFLILIALTFIAPCLSWGECSISAPRAPGAPATVGDVWRLKTNIQFSTRRASGALYETLQSANHDDHPCASAERQRCYRQIQLEMITTPREPVSVPENTRFRIQRQQGFETYLSWGDRIGNYLRLRCSHLARLPNGNIEARGDYVCTEQDLRQLFNRQPSHICEKNLSDLEPPPRETAP